MFCIRSIARLLAAGKPQAPPRTSAANTSLTLFVPHHTSYLNLLARGIGQTDWGTFTSPFHKTTRHAKINRESKLLIERVVSPSQQVWPAQGACSHEWNANKLACYLHK